MFETLGRDPDDVATIGLSRPEQPTPTLLTWLHGGDSGDLIYALAAMRACRGGHLYLTCIDGTHEPMTDTKVEFLAPLLSAQHYVQGVAHWQGEPQGGGDDIENRRRTPYAA